jgi:hypothetical protein
MSKSRRYRRVYPKPQTWGANFETIFIVALLLVFLIVVVVASLIPVEWFAFKTNAQERAYGRVESGTHGSRSPIDLIRDRDGHATSNFCLLTADYSFSSPSSGTGRSTPGGSFFCPPANASAVRVLLSFNGAGGRDNRPAPTCFTRRTQRPQREDWA